MARTKRRVNKDESLPSNGLETPWASSPTSPPRYVLTCYNHESERLYIVNSRALYAIRKLFDAIVEDNEVEPSPADDKMVTFGEVDIKSDQLDAILAHQYTKAEEAWELPYPYPADIERFLKGPRMAKEVKTPDDTPRTFAKAKPKIDRDKLTSIQVICDEIKMEAREARGILRKAKLEKPAGGWLFDDAKTTEIKALLIKERKK